MSLFRRLKTRRPPPRCRPQVECLEGRLAPAAGLTDPDRVVTPAALALPRVGVPVVDPVFGTTIRRVSDASDRGGYETQIYSQLQAFSADDAYLLLAGSDGYVVRRLDDLGAVAGLDTSGWNAPRWHPTRPHTVVHFDTNEDNDVTVQYTDVDTRVTADVFTFPAQYTHVYNNQSFDEISEDGRWMAGMVRRADGEPVVFAYNLAERRLGALLPLHQVYTTYARPDPEWGEVWPDWVGVSPLGNYLVVGWARDGTAGASGVETLDLETGAFVGRVNDGHQHGDLGLRPDGRTEVYFTFEVYGSPADRNRPAIGERLLPGTATASEPTYLRSIDWGNGEHISARGPAGAALVTAGTDPANGWTAFEGEVWLQRTDGGVLRLAHHRSTSSDYWVQPRATISRDGRYVVFASDWGRPTGGRGDPYVIDLGAPPPPAPALPQLRVGDVSLREGNARQTTATFVVTLSAAAGRTVTVQYATADGTAAAGSDYRAAGGTITFRPGETVKTVTVPVLGDRLDEPNESFVLNLANPVNAAVADGQGQGTIIDDDPPAIAIGDVRIAEGHSGPTAAVFTVTLSSAADAPVTVQYASADGTARAGSDYLAAAGTLTFRPGETTKTITVLILGDRRKETNETFYLRLLNPANATLSVVRGAGTILDDDASRA